MEEIYKMEKTESGCDSKWMLSNESSGNGLYIENPIATDLNIWELSPHCLFCLLLLFSTNVHFLLEKRQNKESENKNLTEYNTKD